jgi:hypothetical protein
MNFLKSHIFPIFYSLSTFPLPALFHHSVRKFIISTVIESFWSAQIIRFLSCAPVCLYIAPYDVSFVCDDDAHLAAPLDARAYVCNYT